MKLETDFLFPCISAAILILLVGLPLAGLPPGVPGIPIWYQDSFFIAWAVLGVGAVFVAFVLARSWMVKSGAHIRIRWNMVDAAVLALGVYIVLRILYQEVVPQSSWVQVAFLFGTYFVGRGLFSLLNKESVPWLIGGILIVGIAQAAYGLGQLYGFWSPHHNLFPITGSFFNPGPFSGWLACIVPVAVYSIISRKSTVLPVLGWIYIFICGLVLIPAGSRAGILAALAGTGIVLWPRVKAIKLWKSRAIKIGIGGVFIVLLAGLYFMKKDSADGRILIWKVTGDMIADHPLFGVGWDRFSMYYNNYQALYFENGRGTEHERYIADYVEYGFNEGLELIAEFGLTGMMLVICIVLLLIYKWRRIDDSSDINFELETNHIGHTYENKKYLVLAICISWIFFSMFSYPMSIPPLIIVFSLGIAVLNTLVLRSFDTLKSVSLSNSLLNRLYFLKQTILNPIVFLVILGSTTYGWFWSIHFRPLAQNWVRANLSYRLGQYEMANMTYKDLYIDFNNEGLYLQYSGKSHSQTRKFMYSAQILERSLHFSADPTIFTTLGKDYTLFSKMDSEKYARAEFLLSRSRDMAPNKYYSRYLLAKLYEFNGDKNKAIAEAEKLLTISPKVRSKATDEIRMEMNRIISEDVFEATKSTNE